MIFSGGIRLRIDSDWTTPLTAEDEKIFFYSVRLMINEATMEFLSRAFK